MAKKETESRQSIGSKVRFIHLKGQNEWARWMIDGSFEDVEGKSDLVFVMHKQLLGDIAKFIYKNGDEFMDTNSDNSDSDMVVKAGISMVGAIRGGELTEAVLKEFGDQFPQEFLDVLESEEHLKMKAFTSIYQDCFGIIIKMQAMKHKADAFLSGSSPLFEDPSESEEEHPQPEKDSLLN